MTPEGPLDMHLKVNYFDGIRIGPLALRLTGRPGWEVRSASGVLLARVAPVRKFCMRFSYEKNSSRVSLESRNHASFSYNNKTACEFLL